MSVLGAWAAAAVFAIETILKKNEEVSHEN